MLKSVETISSTYAFTVFKWNVKVQETWSQVSLWNTKSHLGSIISLAYAFTVFKWNVTAQET